MKYLAGGAIVALLVAASMLAACDPVPPMPGNQVGEENVVIDNCTDAEGRVCP